jgi:aspartate/methionine/tyrosine aminotransferase
MKETTRLIDCKAALFTESVVLEMTRLAQQYEANNLAQGFPGFSIPPFIKDAACEAIKSDIRPVADQTDVSFSKPLLEEYAVAMVPGSSLHQTAESGEHLIRFALCRTLELLESAGKGLLLLRK